MQIEDTDGRLIPGFTFADGPEIYGDAIRQIVQWQNSANMSPLAGKPICVRVILRDADFDAFGLTERK